MAFSNHDVERHVTRWAGMHDKADMARFCIALIGALRGSLCLYQGEELGLTEASLTYDQLQDPYGIRFWPDFKGRDGCRTPYPWDGNQPNGGFTEGAPWLPVSDEHLAHGYRQQTDDASSVMSAYRSVLAARNAAPTLLSGELNFIECTDWVLSFERSNANEKRYCVYNFGHHNASIDVPSGYEAAVSVDAFTSKAKVVGNRLTLGALGSAMLIRPA